MKISNPKSRYHLQIHRKDKVLEVGGGHNPHKRSNVVVDKYVDSNYHRHSDIKVLKNQRFMEADGENLPFKDQEFDYVICNQVLEHVESPEAFLREQMRVARRGYLETPSLIGEYLFPKESHKWLVLEVDGKLVMVEKEKYWFQSNFDFGYLFLTWFQKISMPYKLLMKSQANFMTTRYEWEGEIDFEVNPTDPEVLKYFASPWDDQMVKQYFPSQPKHKEWASTLQGFFQLSIGAVLR